MTTSATKDSKTNLQNTVDDGRNGGVLEVSEVYRAELIYRAPKVDLKWAPTKTYKELERPIRRPPAA